MKFSNRSNKLYAGYVINGKTEIKDFIEKTRIIKDKSEWYEKERPDFRIIPLELWEKAQNVNNQNNSELSTTLHKKMGNKHLFSTLITCPVCGYSFRRIQKNEKNYIRTYWCCSGRNHHGSAFCNNRTIINESELIESIDNYFHSIIADRQSFMDKIIKQYENLHTDNSNIILTSQLDKLEIKKAKYKNMYVAEIISMDELKKETSEIDRQIASIKLKIKNTLSPDDIEKKAQQLYKLFSENFEKYMTIANMTNAELKTLIKSIIADKNGNIQIELNY